jgi:hypothetical protein
MGNDMDQSPTFLPFLDCTTFYTRKTLGIPQVTVHGDNMMHYALRVNGYKEEDRMITKGTKDTEV